MYLSGDGVLLSINLATFALIVIVALSLVTCIVSGIVHVVQRYREMRQQLAALEQRLTETLHMLAQHRAETARKLQAYDDNSALWWQELAVCQQKILDIRISRVAQRRRPGYELQGLFADPGSVFNDDHLMDANWFQRFLGPYGDDAPESEQVL
jgi:hypothetical protein